MSTNVDQIGADYTLSDADADVLKGAALIPVDLRVQLLTRYMREHGDAALLNLFAQFVGVANTVANNCREAAEMLLILEGGMYPHQAEKANLPTIFGALNGVKLANGVRQDKLCDGCAFRRGTPANTSPSTTIDASDCADDGTRFMCHERHLDAQGEPTQLCVGFAQALRVPV
jgi:hypothetical protein